MPAVFKITDGTTEIDLISPDFGFHLNDWIPVTPGYKGGGTFRSSPLASGRRLVNYEFDNIVETLDMKVNDVDPDSIIRDFQNMRRLLVKAADYWATDWQDEPVWIEAKADCETNTRYAIIHLARIPEDDNPFAQPFLQAKGVAAMDNIILQIEHGPWTENQPGTGTAIEVSAVEAYDGRNLGNVDTTGTRDPSTTNEVYVANKRNVANITDIYYWDSVGGAWSPNLMDAVLPFNLLPNPVAAGDVIIFGIDTSLADSGPFCSLVFDLSVAQNDLTTIVWRYSDAGADPTAWGQLTVQDNTALVDPFDRTGIHSVHWRQPSDWTTQNPQVGANPPVGITGYWVAAHVTVVGAAPTPPTQQNRDIYSVVWPYVDILAAQVGGDIPALMRTLLSNWSGNVNWPTAGYTNLGVRRVIAGLRSYDRGPDFTAYINIADEQNPAGITVTPDLVDTTFQTLTNTATGRYALYNPGGVQPLGERVVVQIDGGTGLHDDYRGTFHIYLRGYQSGGAPGDVTVNLRVEFAQGVPEVIGQTVSFVDGNNYELLDLGVFDLMPPQLLRNDESTDAITFRIFIGTSNAAASMYVYDLILIPVDEWAADMIDWGANNYGLLVVTTTTVTRYLDIDSIRHPKRDIRALLKETDDDSVTDAYQVITNGKAILQANARQRLWFLTEKHQPTLVEGSHSFPDVVHSALIKRNQQYQSMRGDR